MEITSVNNELVKECVKLQQKKYREQTGKFLLEGYKAIKEAQDYGIKFDKIFVDKTKTDRYTFLKDIIITTPQVLKKISTTESAPEAVAIGVQKEYSLEDLGKRVVLLENIKDAGNLGTIIRSAVAFRAEGIVLYGDCIDLYNPKCVRSTVGNLWKLPIIDIVDFSQLKDKFKNYERIATLPRAKKLLKSYTLSQDNVLIMFGSEADGLSKELTDFATEYVKIEMSDKVESLNLATSVSVILYELFI